MLDILESAMEKVGDSTLHFLTKKADWVLTSEVAKAVGVSRVTMTQYLRELLGKGLVERRRLGRASMWRIKKTLSVRLDEPNMLSARADKATRQAYAERDAYLKVKAKLLADPNYAGKFVAVLRGRIVDADSDEKELVRRVYGKHGYVPIYVERLKRERRILEAPSPEWKH
jgi:DNA-binding transcriptional ArsR family regulator